MATLVVPFGDFECVEENAEFASRAIKITVKMHLIPRIVYSLVTMTMALRLVAKAQDYFIGQLEEGLKNHRDPADGLISSATRLEHIVELNRSVIDQARAIGFPSWETYINDMEHQSERLDAIAETFRMLSSREFHNRISALIETAEVESASATKDEWRDFVATLHD
jgi:hypothetical protein